MSLNYPTTWRRSLTCAPWLLRVAAIISLTIAALLAQAPETTTFQSVPPPGTRSTNVTVTATTTATNGNVILTADGHYIGQGTFNASGVASITSDQLPSGRSIIKVTYVSSATFGPSSSYTSFINQPSGTTLSFNASQVTGGPDGFHVYAADVNLDGHTDILEANISAHTITVLLGNGDGTFQAPASYATGSATSSPRGIAVADFNGDGIPDLAVANGDTTASLLLNNGNGTFGAATTIYTGGGSSLIEDVAAYDLDGDGKMDLCIVDEFGGQAVVLFGNGNGTFAAPVIAFTGALQPLRVVGGQFTNGFGDFAVADQSAGKIVLTSWAGGRTVANSQTILVSGPTAMAAADYNNDGLTDLLVITGNGSNLTFYPGTLTGLSAPGTTISLGAINNGLFLASGDFNGDGNLDAVVIGNAGSNGQVQIFTGNGSGTFSAGTAFPVAANPNGVTAGDFNGDGRDDFAGGELSGTPIDLFLAFGPPATISVVSGNNQQATVATAFGAPLQAIFKDSSGNGVGGINATFTAPPSGASGLFPNGATSAIFPTNSQGVAVVPSFTANTIAGSYGIDVGFSNPPPGFTTPGLFTLTNNPGAASSVTITGGSGQTTNINTAFSQPLSVVVHDSFGNPVPGVIVTFSAPSSGASGTFPSGTITNVATNASGVATTPTFTANGIAGAYTVNATASGVPPVAFSLNNTGGLVTSAPSSLTFTVTQPTATLPGSQTLSLTGPGTVSFTVTASTSSGGNWLTAAPPSGVTPSSVTVSLLAAALQLAPGSYSGSIKLQSATNQTIVPVTLTVLAPFDRVSNGLSFVYVSGSSGLPPSQTLTITSSNRPLPFNVSYSAPWLMVNPLSSTTTASLTVSVNPSGLVADTYSTVITISSLYSSNGSLSIPVTLQIQTVTSASPQTLVFAASQGQNPTAPQSLSISGSSGVSFSASPSTSWILVNPTSGVTPASLAVRVDPTGLAAGSYTGFISISTTGATNLSVPVAVTVQPVITVVTNAGSGTVFLKPTSTPGVLAADTSVVANTSGSTFTATIDGPGLVLSPESGTLPVVLHVSDDVSKFAPGTYQGAITLNIPDANPSTRTLPVSFTVSPPQPPQVATQAPGFTFSLTSNSPTASRQALISNLGSGAINFTASADQPWIQVSPSSGSTTSVGSAPITIDLDLTGFAPGTYHGSVSVSSASNSVNIPISVSVSPLPTGIAVSLTGLTFSAVAGGSSPPPQSFVVLNTGALPFGFSVTTSVASGPATWLTAIPPVGSTDSASTVQVAVNTTGLAAGTYYGQVQVFSTNPEQSVTVVLNVAPVGALILPSIAPTGLLFTATANGQNPAAQTITIQNPTTSPVQFLSTPVSTGPAFFSYDPPSGKIAPGASQTITVTTTPTTVARSLPAGVYQAQLNLGFVGYDVIQPIAILLVVAPQTAAGGKARNQLQTSAPTCTPTKLLPVFTMLGANFSVSAGFPATIQIRVADDCANLINGGSVVTTFSNGDPPLSLKSVGGGSWAATWVPRNPTANGVITGSAAMNLSTTKSITGTVQIAGNALNNATTPVVASGGVVNAASFAKNSAIPPGALVTIFGSHLADQQSSANVLPLPIQLGSTMATIDGQTVPLLFASDGQINAVVPFALQQNVTHLLVVTKGNTISVPEPITIANAEPAIFTANGSGTGQGVVLGVRSNGAQILADANNPVSAGQYIVMYATGLGSVTPTVDDGAAGPTAPLSLVSNSTSLTIGGADATIAYAGLAPGFASLYQVNAIVPSVPPGNAVPLVLTVGGQSSPPVTIAVK